MNEREVRVTFRKQVSDSAYGTESAEISLSGYAEPGDDDDDATAEGLLMAARRLVHAELARSPAAAVRRAVGAAATPLPSGPPAHEDVRLWQR